MNAMLTDKTNKQIESHGLSVADIDRQLQIFKHGIPFTEIVQAASVENGIHVFSEKEQQDYVDIFNSCKSELDLLKFVPASGAATRMFRFLHRFLDNYTLDQNIETFLQKEENKDLRTFFDGLPDFAFSDMVFESLKSKFPDFQDLEKGKRYLYYVQELLGEDGLDFDRTPKGLVPFHKYGNAYVTAFGEQLFEAAFYATSNGIAKIHFTVSDEHEMKFKERFDKIQDLIEHKTGVKFKIVYSFQKKETDTVTATLDNQLFLDENDNPVFRPSGHGALLDNLNQIQADIIFIKNIDNVVTEKYVETIAFHKKVLAGKLISLQQKIFKHIKKLNSENPSEATLKEIGDFISEELKIPGIALNKTALLEILDRPIRVCGVVKNTGAPGGGPFLIKEKNERTSFQIVEMSQIDLSNPQQKALVDEATHFNPVDLVCGVRNYEGEKFDLWEFSDPETGFISKKSYRGKSIKALELPGLWNGAMANWNTIFVEVPLITFNPVKTVNDLLKEVRKPT